jgi:hypothetical protein
MMSKLRKWGLHIFLYSSAVCRALDVVCSLTLSELLVIPFPRLVFSLNTHSEDIIRRDLISSFSN